MGRLDAGAAAALHGAGWSWLCPLCSELRPPLPERRNPYEQGCMDSMLPLQG